METVEFNPIQIPLVDHPMAQNYQRRSVAFNLPKVSEALQGLEKGELIIITGSPGSGKSQLARGICLDLINQACLCSYVSYELSYGQLLNMFILAGLNETENRKLVISPIDVAERDVAFIENLVEKTKVDLIIVDDIHALTMKYAFNPRIADNMASYLRGIADKLKELAIKHNIIVITMVHTRKDSIDNKTSSLSDMAYSGGFAQVADSVISIRTDKKDGCAILDITKARFTGNKISVKCKSINKKFKEIDFYVDHTPAGLVDSFRNKS